MNRLLICVMNNIHFVQNYFVILKNVFASSCLEVKQKLLLKFIMYRNTCICLYNTRTKILSAWLLAVVNGELIYSISTYLT